MPIRSVDARPVVPPAKPESAAFFEPTQVTVDMPEGIGTKTYSFPAHFHHVKMATAQFALDSKTVAQWLPPGLEPAPLLGPLGELTDTTRGMVTVQYMTEPPDGMPPYTEATFAVRVRRPDGKVGWHTLALPVTSLENKVRGTELFGYPKEMGQVALAVDDKAFKGTVKTADGKSMFTVAVGGSAPLTFDVERDNTNFQQLRGQNVELRSRISSELRPAGGDVTFGDALISRFPGLPRKPAMLFAGQLADADLQLSLPRTADAASTVVLPSTAARPRGWAP